jgi:site-specific DNA-methyltransferase (adenine-specific)
MKKMKDNCVDSIITDPPYGLTQGKKGGSGAASLNLNSPAGRSRITTGGGFMGQQWDAGIPGIEYWQEMLRVTKPGAILLSFGGTRTFHRLACLIEDAGWEVRDCLCYLFGSGFPKSLDIGKAIDKAAGAEREVIGPNPNSVGRTKNITGGNYCNAHYQKRDLVDVITKPATDESALWDGWGTALKPAYEPIIVAMKPLDGTFAQNALKWGVAGLNIDGCRIPTKDNLNGGGYSNGESKGMWTPGKDGGGFRRLPGEFVQPPGRWPANVVLDEESSKLLDAQTKHKIHSAGSKCDGSSIKSKETYAANAFHMGQHFPHRFGDSGGASRFFYCAKASPKERGGFNRHPTLKPLALLRYLCLLTKTPTGGVVLDPFMGSGTTGVACLETGRKFVGIEKEKDYFEIAKRRIQEKIKEK